MKNLIRLACFLSFSCLRVPLLQAMSSSYPEMKRPAFGKDVELGENGVLRSVPTIMNYVDASSSQVMHIRRQQTGDDQSIEGVVWNSVEVNVKNGRSLHMTMNRNGFELMTDSLGKQIDFFDTQDVITNYYPSCEDLLRRVLGQDVLVKAFDHNVRLNERAENAGTTLKRSGGSKAQQPLGVVHGDYTRTSAPQRILQLAGPPKVNDVLRLLLQNDQSLLERNMVDEAVRRERRYALINVWRNIDPKTPVKSQALACVDAQSVVANDLRTLQIHYADRIGENYLPYYNPKHEWYFFPEMTIDEALLIKQWDSHGGIASGQSRDSSDCASFSIHSAFFGPDEENDATSTVGRSSLRLHLVVFDPATAWISPAGEVTCKGRLVQWSQSEIISGYVYISSCSKLGNIVLTTPSGPWIMRASTECAASTLKPLYEPLKVHLLVVLCFKLVNECVSVSYKLRQCPRQVDAFKATKRWRRPCIPIASRSSCIVLEVPPVACKDMRLAWATPM